MPLIGGLKKPTALGMTGAGSPSAVADFNWNGRNGAKSLVPGNVRLRAAKSAQQGPVWGSRLVVLVNVGFREGNSVQEGPLRVRLPVQHLRWKVREVLIFSPSQRSQSSTAAKQSVRESQCRSRCSLSVRLSAFEGTVLVLTPSMCEPIGRHAGSARSPIPLS